MKRFGIYLCLLYVLVLLFCHRSGGMGMQGAPNGGFDRGEAFDTGSAAMG